MSPPTGKPRLFGVRADVLAIAEPIGSQRAGQIFDQHPRSPKPIIQSAGPGSKSIYSIAAAMAFWQDVAENGVPTEVSL